MFYSAFINLLFREERDGNVVPFIEKRIITTMRVCAIDAMNVCVMAIITFYAFPYISEICRYIWILLLNLLTTEKKWLKLSLMAICTIVAAEIIIVINAMSIVINKNFMKLKEEINEKDEKIRDLEERILKLAQKVQENCVYNEKEKLKKQITDLSQLTPGTAVCVEYLDPSCGEPTNIDAIECLEKANLPYDIPRRYKGVIEPRLPDDELADVKDLYKVKLTLINPIIAIMSDDDIALTDDATGKKIKLFIDA